MLRAILEMRVAITGGRSHRPDPLEMLHFENIWSAIGGTVLLHGACPDPWDYPKSASCDMELDRWARKRGIPVESFEADWRAHGKAAGPIRNAAMVATADALVVFPGGRGTRNCEAAARDRGVAVHRIEGRRV
jgi:hypothetical protein